MVPRPHLRGQATGPSGFCPQRAACGCWGFGFLLPARGRSQRAPHRWWWPGTVLTQAELGLCEGKFPSRQWVSVEQNEQAAVQGKRPVWGLFSGAPPLGLWISRHREPKAQGAPGRACSWISGQPLPVTPTDVRRGWCCPRPALPPVWSWLLPGALTHFPFCRAVAAVPCQEEDSAGGFPLVSIHPR